MRTIPFHPRNGQVFLQNEHDRNQSSDEDDAYLTVANGDAESEAIAKRWGLQLGVILEQGTIQ